MFANEEFITATRPFVCIRIETYENAASEKMVRSLLGGRFANTSFCIFDPTGKERLSRSGRSPSVLARRRAKNSTRSILTAMQRIAADYEPTDASEPALLPDSDTFRQALNVAAGDQRLLIVVTTDERKTRESLREVLSDEEVVGRFHTDLIDEDVDADWAKSIEGERRAPGILIVRSGQFGLEGTVMRQLPEKAGAKDIKKALLESNAEFASEENRKIYKDHVSAGLKEGIRFLHDIPHGEDRDADGVRDRDQRRRRRRR